MKLNWSRLSIGTFRMLPTICSPGCAGLMMPAVKLVATMTDIRPFGVLVCDNVGLALRSDGRPDIREVATHVERQGAVFLSGSPADYPAAEPGSITFYYRPELATPADVAAETTAHHYDVLIAAAKIIPAEARVAVGAVRIGAGTGNMRSASWGGSDGLGGAAALMNTPGINARATAQMVLKAILHYRPDLPVSLLHGKVMARTFDTARDLSGFPTSKVEGMRIGVIGAGNIGREVARLCAAFKMNVVVHARERHRVWIEAAGHEFAPTLEAAARDVDILTIHTGLGPIAPKTGTFANSGLISAKILSLLQPGALVINYDRGEVLDVAALRNAMASGRVRDVAIDADIFLHGGEPSGPLLPYLELGRLFGDRISLLPHAAADTDHPSRVSGAKQAVDMTIALLRERRVHNLVGALPHGLVDGGKIGVPGITPIDRRAIHDLDRAAVRGLAETSKSLADFLFALAAGEIDQDNDLGAGVVAANQVATRLQDIGLMVPFDAAEP
ncbi:NAD(P)-dependent oxidoreductase [Devosia sp. A369]